jgi:hypothetical protein
MQFPRRNAIVVCALIDRALSKASGLFGDLSIDDESAARLVSTAAEMDDSAPPPQRGLAVYRAANAIGRIKLAP